MEFLFARVPADWIEKVMVLMLMVRRLIAQQGRMTGELLVRSDGRGASTRLDVAPTVVVLLCLLSLRALS